MEAENPIIPTFTSVKEFYDESETPVKCAGLIQIEVPSDTSETDWANLLSDIAANAAPVEGVPEGAMVKGVTPISGPMITWWIAENQKLIAFIFWVMIHI